MLSSRVLPVPASSCAPQQRQAPPVVSGSALRACGHALGSACRRAPRQAGGAGPRCSAHLLAVDRLLQERARGVRDAERLHESKAVAHGRAAAVRGWGAGAVRGCADLDRARGPEHAPRASAGARR